MTEAPKPTEVQSPKVLYNEDGEPVEGAIPAEEAQKIKDELETVKQEKAKLENKDFNFKRLRDMTKQETDKLTEKEIALIKNQEKLEEQISSFANNQTKANVDDVLNVLAGEDVKMRELIEAELKNFPGDNTNKSDLQARARKAFLIVTGEANMSRVPNPLFQAHRINGSSSAGGSAQAKQFNDNEKALASKMGISEDDMKNYNPKYKA